MFGLLNKKGDQSNNSPVKLTSDEVKEMKVILKDLKSARGLLQNRINDFKSSSDKQLKDLEETIQREKQKHDPDDDSNKDSKLRSAFEELAKRMASDLAQVALDEMENDIKDIDSRIATWESIISKLNGSLELQVEEIKLDSIGDELPAAIAMVKASKVMMENPSLFTEKQNEKLRSTIQSVMQEAFGSK